MVKKVVNGVIRDWGEQVGERGLKGRKGLNIRKGQSSNRKSPSKKSSTPMSTKAKLKLTINKTPEVMVKISGGGKNMGAISAHFDYISRNGKVEIEDENGHVHKGVEEVKEAKDSWEKGRIGIPKEGGKRKEAFNIILSMPEGTDRDKVKKAAREFAKAEFSDHQYVFASHEDEKHPHVHLSVKAVDKDGIRLNPRKADLQAWRESFALSLREQGIAANATPRRARGVVRKAKKQKVEQIDKSFEKGERKAPAKVTLNKDKLAEKEVRDKIVKVNPYADEIEKTRKAMLKTYGKLSGHYKNGTEGDKKFAKEIEDFVKSFPSGMTDHELRVKNILDGTGDIPTEKEKTMKSKKGIKKQKITKTNRAIKKPKEGDEEER
jgi:hypothetical protein